VGVKVVPSYINMFLTSCCMDVRLASLAGLFQLAARVPGPIKWIVWACPKPAWAW